MPGSRADQEREEAMHPSRKKTPMQYTPEEKFKENEHVKIYTEI